MHQLHYAIVRGVPNSYDQCIRTWGDGEKINVELAQKQHRKYCETLQTLGLELIYINLDDRYPDCCFAEDPAIVIGDIAIVCRLGAESRRGEEDEIEKVLGKYRKTTKVEYPGTIEGGDVLKIDDKIFIGISRRTNVAAINQIRELLAPMGYQVVSVKTKDLVHLKSDCAYIGNGYFIMRRGRFDETVFDGYNKLIVPEEEAYAANCLAVNGKVIVSDGYQETKRLVIEAGFETVSVEMSEFRKGEGALTCLSILFDD